MFKTKRIIHVCIIVLFTSVVALLIAPSAFASEKSYSMKKGDILFTNDTSSSLVGHVGIAVNNKYILHIPGPKQITELLTLKQWKSKYSKPSKYTWVYRVDSTTLANEAGDWAVKNYYNTKGSLSSQNIKPKYDITVNLTSKNPTYCSKIVYQAYFNADKVVKGTFVNKRSGIVKPRDFRSTVFYQMPKEVAVIVN